MADAPTASSTVVTSHDHTTAPSAVGDDALLVKRVQSGEMAAFDQLIVKYRERLFSVVYNLTSNRDDANDLTQEAFIRAFRSISKFKGNSSFFTWLYRIAVNTTITHLKRNRKRRFFSFEQMDEEGSSNVKLESLASRAKTDKPTYMRELQEKLNDALQKLSVKHRTVVVLYEIEGLSHQEIAEITKTSEGTVRSRLHYAKQQLRETLKDYLE
ncbi:RNA polymerase sigma factor [Cerasicoccus arenae]|uniref:RNA polymerase sigma factor n=1 Tax=Cerasicoccus arenae TaxID=424488 RepID=A0A8J3DCD8_9BACT|nr:sigma-70 family RNA polymerase sigma factor [Cerasicoccus arenae]MBK1858435.1 sigma-70 family RNA polymerase sigma factor [Cerasicoccus arenae]GHC02554.1 RNA polymerase sigma factor [Cerasicoccus arenae]